MVARYLPPEQYEPFIDTLFAKQDHWVFGAGSVSDALWALAKDAGMDRPTFDQALADTGCGTGSSAGRWMRRSAGTLTPLRVS